MRYTKNVDSVTSQAAEEARLRGDGLWGREHVLLALTRLDGETGARGAQILKRLGIEEQRVREAIGRYRPPRPALEAAPPEPGEPPTQLVFAGDETERVFIHTRWVAAYLGKRTADTEHLLLGVLSDDSPQDRYFAELGLRFEDVYQELTGEPTPEEVRPPRAVIIPIGDLDTALHMLPDVLPKGVYFSFNYDDERAWFDTSSDVDLDAYMQRALTQAGDAPNEGDDDGA